MRAEETHLRSSRPGPVCGRSVVAGSGKGRFEPSEAFGVSGADIPEELEHPCQTQRERRIDR